MPDASLRDPEEDLAKTGKTSARGGDDFLRGFFTLLSDNRFNLMKRTGSTWDAREKRKVNGAADGPC